MKILCVTSTIDPKSGGWGRYSFSVLREYEKNGVDFIVCTEQETGMLSEERPILHRVSLGNFVRNIFWMRRMAQTYDVVHAFDAWPYAIYGYLAVLGTNKKLFISGHGTYTVSPLDKPVIGFLMRRVYRRAQEIFCNSRYTAERILERMPDARATVVPLGTEVIEKPSEDVLNKIKAEIEGRSPVILSVGALKKRKGQLYTLQAVDILKKDYPNILYVLVGDDSDIYYKNQIIEFARTNHLEQNILFKSNISDEELAGWYEIADCLALNSINHDGHFEGFGLVIIEAGQFGTPAVGSRNCGIEDAIVDGSTGYLAEQESPEDIAQGITNAFSVDEDEVKKHSQTFDWSITAKNYTNSYMISDEHD